MCWWEAEREPIPSLLNRSIHRGGFRSWKKPTQNLVGMKKYDNIVSFLYSCVALRCVASLLLNSQYRDGWMDYVAILNHCVVLCCVLSHILNHSNSIG